MAKAVGEIIRDQREQKRLSKSAFARKLGCSPQNIDSLESRKSIDFEMAQKISLILEFDIFESFRVFHNDQSIKEKRLAKKHTELSAKYTTLLEKYNSLLESSIKYGK
jgi:transcriptional regulator with XRE-family HTH domain